MDYFGTVLDRGAVQRSGVLLRAECGCNDGEGGGGGSSRTHREDNIHTVSKFYVCQPARENKMILIILYDSPKQQNFPPFLYIP